MKLRPATLLAWAATGWTLASAPAAAAATLGDEQLTSYLERIGLAPAEAALESGDLEAAARLLAAVEEPAAEPSRSAVRVLRARLAAARGEHGAAAAQWASAATTDPSAASWLEARSVHAALAAGRVDAAAAAAERIPLEHRAADAARRAAAAALGTGNAGRALALLGPLDPGEPPGTLALRGRLAAAAGRPAEAGAAFRQLHLLHPAAREAREAADALRAAPKSAAPLSDEEETVRLERLLDAHRNDQVIREGERLLGRVEPKSALGCRIRFAVGKANRKARNYRDAIDTLSAVAADCTDPELRVKTLYLWGSASSIALKDPALEVYEKLVAEFPDHAFADDALFFISDLHLRAGRTARSKAALQRQLAAYPDGDYAGEALWRLFWMEWTADRPARGVQHLDASVKRFGDDADDFEVERALYWKARVLARQKRADAALDLYEKLVKEFPLSYHSLLALRRLETEAPERARRLKASLPRPPATPARFAYPVRGAFRDAAPVRAGLHLLRLGLHPEAADLLATAGELASSRDELLALALALYRAGDPHASHWLIRTRVKGFDSDWPDAGTWEVWRAAYPLAFRERVLEATGEQGVPVELVQGLIREESALDPAVVSWAGAVGLAQLMPLTARDIARRLRYRGEIDLEALQDPQLNLRLSARYLRDLLRQFDQHPALAIASYNAGERTVGGWVAARGGQDTDVFIESMTIAQTRRYTRRVLRSYATYLFLYGDGDDRFLSLPLTVPAPRKSRP